MDAEIQAMDGNQATVQVLDSGKMQPRSFMFAVAGTSVVAPSLPSLDAGCIWDIHVPYPSGGEAVQIGCPADLSGIPDGNDGPP